MQTSPRIALAFAYDGTLFESFARQPGRRTVEDELLAALVRLGAVEDPRRVRFEVASRTDKGVSAWWNVAAFDTAMHPARLVHGLRLPDGLFALASSPVDASFSPRRAATRREYAYHLEGLPRPVFARCLRAARRFEGLHDFAAFCRPEPGRGTVRRVERVSGSFRAGSGELRFAAPSFLWEQVRRMVHAALAVARGERSELALVAQLRGASRRQAEPAAEAAPLVLAQVEIPLEWRFRSRDASRMMARAHREIRLRERFYAGFSGKDPTVRR